MTDKIHIALLDNGVAPTFYGSPENSIYIDEENNLQQYTEDSNKISHGTICSIVLKYYAPDSLFSSIKILQSDGRGLIEKLTPALEWCWENNVEIVNLSLGSTHFMDRQLIRSVINYYTNKGIVFVCAGSNSGYTSYPASFSNVIGVTAGVAGLEDEEYRFISNIHTGIDILSFTICSIPIEDQKFEIPQSNSYTTPFITSKVYDIIKKNSDCSVFQIKKKLLEGAQNPTALIQFYNNPDWIYNACIVGGINLSSKAAPYFHLFKGCSYSEVKEIVDTIILFDREDIDIYLNEKKKLVYLGEGYDKNAEDRTEFFWCGAYKEYQIEKCNTEKFCLDVPMIIINFSADLDELWILQQLRCKFGEEAYNVYASSLKVQSILYDLEYIPLSCIKGFGENRKILAFLSEEVYCKKIDAVIIGSGGNSEALDKFASETAAQLKIDITKTDRYTVHFCDNEGNMAVKEYEGIEDTEVKSIYMQIKNMLTGEATHE